MPGHTGSCGRLAWAVAKQSASSMSISWSRARQWLLPARHWLPQPRHQLLLPRYQLPLSSHRLLPFYHRLLLPRHRPRLPHHRLLRARRRSLLPLHRQLHLDLTGLAIEFQETFEAAGTSKVSNNVEKTPANAPAPSVQEELGTIKGELAILHRMLEKMGSCNSTK